MFSPDLRAIQEGSIFGISLRGSIRNIGIVDKMSNGIIKAHGVIGQFDVAFAVDDTKTSLSSEKFKELVRNPELLNGQWAKGMAIAFTGELEPALDEKIRELDRELKGVSHLASKVIVNKYDHEITKALAIMNYEANNPEPEFQFSGLTI